MKLPYVLAAVTGLLGSFTSTQASAIPAKNHDNSSATYARALKQATREEIVADQLEGRLNLGKRAGPSMLPPSPGPSPAPSPGPYNVCGSNGNFLIQALSVSPPVRFTPGYASTTFYAEDPVNSGRTPVALTYQPFDPGFEAAWQLDPNANCALTNANGQGAVWIDASDITSTGFSKMWQGPDEAFVDGDFVKLSCELTVGTVVCNVGGGGLFFSYTGANDDPSIPRFTSYFTVCDPAVVGGPGRCNFLQVAWVRTA